MHRIGNQTFSRLTCTAVESERARLKNTEVITSVAFPWLWHSSG